MIISELLNLVHLKTVILKTIGWSNCQNYQSTSKKYWVLKRVGIYFTYIYKKKNHKLHQEQNKYKWNRFNFRER